MKKTQFILAVTLLASGVAFAGTYEKMVVTPEPVCGPWYVAAYGGGAFYDTLEASRDDIEVGTIGLDNGWVVGGAVGLRTDAAWRFELDLNHSQAGFDTIVDQDDLGGWGDVERTSLMVNAVKEFEALQFLGLTPYLGAGIGLTNVEFGGLIDETVLGYQFMGGLVYDLTECLQVFAEYRLIGQGDLEDYGPYPFGNIDAGWTQQVLMGVRWFF